MQLKIEANNGVPIYEQLVRQVKYAVAEEVVVPGQVIPSVREMARQLAINPNTVQRAYIQLQDERVLQSLRGRGMAVAPDARTRCVSDRHHVLVERLRAVVAEAVHSGLSERQLMDMFQLTLSEVLRESESSQAIQPASDTQPNVDSSHQSQEPNS